MAKKARTETIAEPETMVPTHIQDQIEQMEEVLLAITPDMPWSTLPEPLAFAAQSRQLNTRVVQGNVILFRDDEPLGPTTPKFMQLFGWAFKFPTEFLAKLTPETRSIVINERLRSARPQNFQVVRQGTELTSFTPGWRNLAPFSQIAQAAYNATLDSSTNVEIHNFQWNHDGLSMKLLTDKRTEISPKVGDILRYGISLKYSPGSDINVDQFNERLVCLNGMCSSDSKYSWTTRSTKTIQDQIEWVGLSVRAAMERVEAFAENARLMSTTQIVGDVREVIAARAQAQGIPQRFVGRIYEAWEQEPGTTEWDIINAFTRFGTHGENLDRSLRGRMQSSAGAFVENYELVDATLPRQVARRVGARINERVELN